MSDPVAVAIIGTGRWAGRLAEAARRTPALRLAVCYSRDAQKRVAFAQTHGCAAADSFEAAITWPGVEAVLVVTPNHLHREQVLACAERGKHVFVEKPIADWPADGKAMRQACETAGVALLVGHSFRRLGAARKVKQLIDSGALGTVVLAEANFSLPGNHTPDAWRYYRETCRGGGLMQLGIHHADTLQYWLGPVARVQGSFAHLATQAEVDDVGVALLEFASGARGTISSSYTSPKTYSARLYGSLAVLDYQVDMSVWPHAEQVDRATTLTLATRAGRELVPFEPRDMLVEELEELARCVRGEAQPETGASEGLRALGVIDGALRSHESGQVVDLSATG